MGFDNVHHFMYVTVIFLVIHHKMRSEVTVVLVAHKTPSAIFCNHLCIYFSDRPWS